MRVRVDLIGLFRQRAGTDHLEAEPAEAQPGSQPSVLQCLQAAELSLGGGSLLEAGRLREGVLVFLKEPGGATRRVLRPAEERAAEGQSLVLSTAMGGG